MITKTLTYTNYKGNKVTRKFYFHMSDSEYFEFDLKYNGVQSYVKRLQNQSGAELDIYLFLKDLIVSSYGVKSDDGESFLKSSEERQKFQCSIGFDRIMEDMITNPKQIIKFMAGVSTAKIDKAEINKMMNDIDAKIEEDQKAYEAAEVEVVEEDF